MTDRHEGEAKESESWQTNRKTATATNVHSVARRGNQKKKTSQQLRVSIQVPALNQRFRLKTCAARLIIVVGQKQSNFSTLQSPKVCFPPTLHFSLTSHRTHFFPAPNSKLLHSCTFESQASRPFAPSLG